MAARKKAASQPIVDLVVRRGALRRFDKLKQATAAMPVNVVWDRRTRQNADSSETPSQPDRRRKPPFTWESADFVVVEPRSRKAPRRTKSR
jgi:hypothetical protein